MLPRIERVEQLIRSILNRWQTTIHLTKPEIENMHQFCNKLFDSAIKMQLEGNFGMKILHEAEHRLYNIDSDIQILIALSPRCSMN